MPKKLICDERKKIATHLSIICNDYNVPRTETTKSDCIARTISEANAMPVHMDNQFLLEELIAQIIRKVVNDPETSSILSEYITRTSNQKCPQRYISSRSNNTRDISNIEVVRPRDLPQITGLSRTTIWRLSKSNKFVPRIQLSDGAIGYDKKSILKWLKEHEVA